MFRKTLLIAAAVAMPLGIVAATGGIASAKGSPPVSVANDTITCTGIAVSAKFSPALTLDGGATSNEATTIKGTASGCTTAGPNPVTVTGVKVSGTINDPTSDHSCTGLSGSTPESGTLTLAYKTSPKSTPTTSVVTVSGVSGGTGDNGHATFSIGFSGVTGAFTGTDSGASSTSDAQTTDTTAQIITSCNGKKGLKSIAVQPDTNTGAGAALHIG